MSRNEVLPWEKCDLHEQPLSWLLGIRGQLAQGPLRA